MYRKRNHGVILIVVYLVFLLLVVNSFVDIGPIFPMVLIFGINLLVFSIVFRKVMNLSSRSSTREYAAHVGKPYHEKESDNDSTPKPQPKIHVNKESFDKPSARYDSQVETNLARDIHVYCQYCGEPGKSGQTNCRSCGKKIRG